MKNGAGTDGVAAAVLDASAVVELVLVTRIGEEIRRRLANPGVSLHSPELVDLEVLNTLRSCVRTKRVTPSRATVAVQNLNELDLRRYRHGPMIGRIWARRSNLTAYDAAYVTLAEILDGFLLTTDGRLARAPNLPIPVEVYPSDRHSATNRLP